MKIIKEENVLLEKQVLEQERRLDYLEREVRYHEGRENCNR